MKATIDRLGFSYILTDFDPTFNYLPLIKIRLYDQYIQKWNGSLSISTKLQYYSKYKSVFQFEHYFNVIKDDKLRQSLTCFRLCSHSLDIETGRYFGIDRENRLCRLCNQHVIESEYHFLLCCNYYSDIRKKYLGTTAWPSLAKFVSIMSSNNKSKLLKLAKYLKDAFSRRNNTLDNN